jgi:hypothetical protein
MGRQVAGVLYVVAMITVIVGVAFVFFRNRFWARLIVNIGIVMVFGFLLDIFSASRRPLMVLASAASGPMAKAAMQPFRDHFVRYLTSK